MQGITWEIWWLTHHKTDQMKATLFACIPYERVDPGYTVHLAEIRKRLAYVTLSLLLAWLCAYTQRVALMYSITLSLQKPLFQTGEKGQSDYVNQPFSPSAYPQSESAPLWKRCEDKNLFLTDTSGGGGKLFSIQGVDDLFDSSVANQDHAVRLIFTDVQEAFYTLLSVSLFWCIWACFPVLIYHTLSFFQPGFYAGQSRSVCAFVLKRVIWGYLVLWLVDLFLIPRLLSFFYSFQIERSSLSLHAETKVVSYVSLYVFVYCSVLALLLLTGLWSSYRRRQILDQLSCTTKLRAPSLPAHNPRAFQEIESTSTQFRLKGCLVKRLNRLGNQYREQRGKVWWGCLLVAAFISPPDLSSQFACALLLIVWSEIGVWLAYTSSCRFAARRSVLLSKT